MSSVRERLAEAVKINEYLRKQIEIYHITHNNTESLLEMAQRLNLTKEELELYKEKLAKIEELNESLVVNNSAARRSIPSTPSQERMPLPGMVGNSKIKTAAVFNANLENELSSWKAKYQILKVLNLHTFFSPVVYRFSFFF